MRGFAESMVKLTVFMICAQTLIHFRPREAYEKYLRLLVNLLILLQLILPVRNLIRGGTKESLEEAYGAFQRRMEEYMEGAAWTEYDRWAPKEREDGGEETEEIRGEESEREESEREDGRMAEKVERVEIGEIRIGGDGR